MCDPGAAVLRQFRRATASDVELALRIIEQLGGAESKATGTLLKSLDPAGRMGRDEFEALLGAMMQSRLIEIEEAEFEKDGQLIKFRKVRLTESGREVRSGSGLKLLIEDGIVEEFAARGTARPRANKAAPGGSTAGSTNAGGKLGFDREPVRLSPRDEALAAQIREWRAAEAKRLRVPAYVVMHDRTLAALAQARPKNPRELLLIDGMGPAKVERFGEEILRLCAGR